MSDDNSFVFAANYLIFSILSVVQYFMKVPCEHPLKIIKKTIEKYNKDGTVISSCLTKIVSNSKPLKLIYAFIPAWKPQWTETNSSEHPSFFRIFYLMYQKSLLYQQRLDAGLASARYISPWEKKNHVCHPSETTLRFWKDIISNVVEKSV